MAAIERRNRNEIKHGEQDVDHHGLVENEARGHEKRARVGGPAEREVVDDGVSLSRGQRDQQKQNHRAYSDKHVAHRTRDRGQDVTLNNVLEIPAIHRRGLGPTDDGEVREISEYGKNNRSHGIDVLDGIERDTPEHVGSGIAVAQRHPGVRRLVHADGKQEHNDLDEDVDVLEGHACFDVNTLPLELLRGLAHCFRRDAIDLDGLGRDAAFDVKRLHIFGGNAHSADHTVLADLYAAHHRGMVSDAREGAEFGALHVDDHAVVQIVLVGVDIGIVGDRGTLVDDELAAVIEQNVLVDGAVVLDGEVVAVGNLDAVEDLDVLAAVLEDVARDHGAEAEAQPVIQAGRGAVEHHPEPDEGLALGVLGGVDVAVIFGLKRGVARIETMHRDLVAHGRTERRPGREARPTAQVQFMQRLADNFTAMVRITVHELAVEPLDPGKEGALRIRLRRKWPVFVSGHSSKISVSEDCG